MVAAFWPFHLSPEGEVVEELRDSHHLCPNHLPVPWGIALDNLLFEKVLEHFWSGGGHQPITEADHIVSKHAPQSLLCEDHKEMTK